MRFSDLAVGDIFTIVSCETFDYTHLFKKINPTSVRGTFGSETRNIISLATRSYNAISHVEPDAEVVLQTILIMAKGDGAFTVADQNGKVVSTAESQIFQCAEYLKMGDFFIREGIYDEDWGVCMVCKIYDSRIEVISVSDQNWRYLNFTDSVKKVMRPC